MSVSCEYPEREKKKGLGSLTVCVSLACLCNCAIPNGALDLAGWIAGWRAGYAWPAGPDRSLGLS